MIDKLDPAERVQLQSLVLSTGYKILVRILHDIYDDSVNFLSSLDPVSTDEKSILAAHRKTQAKREFIQELSSRIDSLVSDDKQNSLFFDPFDDSLLPLLRSERDVQ